jgi:hypothetical protein
LTGLLGFSGPVSVAGSGDKWFTNRWDRDVMPTNDVRKVLQLSFASLIDRFVTSNVYVCGRTPCPCRSATVF